MGDLPDKYQTEWSKKRDAWLNSGRKDDSYLLRGAELSAFRQFVISQPQRVTSDDRGFLLACDRRADTSAMMRSQDIEAILLDRPEVTVVGESPAITMNSVLSTAAPITKKAPPAGKRWTFVLLAANGLLLLSMLALGWMVKEQLLQLRASKDELQKTQSALTKKTEAIGQVHDDLTQKSKAKAALEKGLPEVEARRDDLSKSLDGLAQERRSAEEQLKAVESVLAVAQGELTKQRGQRPKGKLRVEYDRLLVKRLLLMLPLRCAKNLADCSDEAIKESVSKLAPNASLRELVSPLSHVVIYPRSVATNVKMLPMRELQLRKLLKLPGDKSDLLVIFCPRLADEKGAKVEARYQILLEYLQKYLKFPAERLLRINQTGLLTSGALKVLAPADRPKNGEVTPAEGIWIVRTPGPRPIAAPPVQPS